MIKSFKEYLKEKKVVKKKSDKELAKSLLKRAKNRHDIRIKSTQINEENASFIFEDIYEAMREAAQSLLAVKGYKPYSHEVIIAFLKENYKEIEPSRLQLLDECRIIRNRLVYEGKTASKERTEKALNLLRKLLPEFEKILKSELNED